MWVVTWTAPLALCRCSACGFPDQLVVQGLWCKLDCHGAPEINCLHKKKIIYCSGEVWFDQIRLGYQKFGWAGWGLEKVKALEALVQEALFSNAGHFTSNTAFSEGTRNNSIRWCSYKWQLSYHKRPTLVQLNILVFLGLMLKRCLFSSDSFFRNSLIACDTGYFYISHCLSCYPSVASFTCHTMKAVIWPLASAIDHVLLIQAQQTVP